MATVAEQGQDEDDDLHSLDFWLHQSLPAGPLAADENCGADRGGSPVSTGIVREASFNLRLGKRR